MRMRKREVEKKKLRMKKRIRDENRNRIKDEKREEGREKDSIRGNLLGVLDKADS